MRLEIASTTLRRARATALRRSLEDLIERLTPLFEPDNRPVRPRRSACNPGVTRAQGSSS